jgi:ABC-type microcin C transport system permease subunit YejB
MKKDILNSHRPPVASIHLKVLLSPAGIRMLGYTILVKRSFTMMMMAWVTQIFVLHIILISDIPTILPQAVTVQGQEAIV